MAYTFARLDIDRARTPITRALLAAKLTQDLADAVGRLWRAYELNDELGDEQPPGEAGGPHYYAKSLDEWTHELWSVRDHWKEKAGMIAGNDWGESAWAGRDAMVRGLACAFVDALTEDIGEESFAEMRAKNAGALYSAEDGPCASHDFCDANMPMLAAFESLFGRQPAWLVEGTDDKGNHSPKAEAELGLWNDAWSLAKREFLTT